MVSFYKCVCQGCSKQPSSCRRKEVVYQHSKICRRATAKGAEDIIIFVVGAEQIRFKIHKELLVVFSKYFEKSRFKTNANGDVVQMPAENPAVIREFVAWLYSGGLTYRSDQDDLPPPEQLWIWGAKIDSTKLMDEAMHLIFAVSATKTYFPGPRIAKAAYTQAKSDSKLRRFVSDAIAAHGPFAPREWTSEDVGDRWVRQWKNTLSLSSSLVTEHVENGFDGKAPEKNPLLPENITKYLIGKIPQGDGDVIDLTGSVSGLNSKAAGKRKEAAVDLDEDDQQTSPKRVRSLGEDLDESASTLEPVEDSAQDMFLQENPAPSNTRSSPKVFSSQNAAQAGSSRPRTRGPTRSQNPSGDRAPGIFSHFTSRPPPKSRTQES